MLTWSITALFPHRSQVSVYLGIAALGQLGQQSYLTRNLTALLALLIYDYFITLPLEISEIWNSRFTAAKLFYFLNRYGVIAFYCVNCVLCTLQTQNILVRSFYSSCMDSDNSSRRESNVKSITFAHHHIAARSSFTRHTFSKKSLIPATSVGKPIQYNEKLLIYS